jgi:5-methyltetrahydropteroyltriglutamate--homocysteine methyltransferase
MTTRTPFETSVIGSLPRPQWVRDMVVAGESGQLTPQQYRDLGDKAAGFAIGLQEAAGVDIVTDGEWRRASYMSIIGQRLSGFEPIEGRAHGFKVVSRLRRERPLLVDDLLFLRESTTRRTKITLPSPYHLCNHRGFEIDPDVYSSREELLNDLVGILAAEARDLAACGVDVIQFDDPRVLILTLEEVRYDHFPRGRGSLEAEMQLASDSLRPVVSECGSARTALHLCRGNSNREVSGSGGYEILMPFLRDMPCDQIMMEYACPEAGELSSLKEFPGDKLLGLGVTDVRGESIDSVDRVVGRVEEALRYVDADRISLNPDCGFAPAMENPIPLDEAYQKLAVQSEAARRLRGAV